MDICPQKHEEIFSVPYFSLSARFVFYQTNNIQIQTYKVKNVYGDLERKASEETQFFRGRIESQI